MIERSYLFSFYFEKNTMNSYIVSFFKDKNIDYFYHMQQIYADILQDGNYRKIIIVDMPGSKKEVYYSLNECIKKNEVVQFSSLRIEPYENIYLVKAIFEDDYIITRINGNYDLIKNYYINNYFSMDSSSEPQKCIDLEFLETIQ